MDNQKYPTFEIGAKDCPTFPYPLSLIFDNNPVFSTCSVGPETNNGGTDCGEDNNNTHSPFTSQAAIVNFIRQETRYRRTRMLRNTATMT